MLSAEWLVPLVLLQVLCSAVNVIMYFLVSLFSGYIGIR